MAVRSSDSQPADHDQSHAGIPVWDRGVRVFHWLLVACVAGTLATGFLGETWLVDAHVILGSALAALLIFRVIWGFTGSTYARFSSFVCRPSTALAHVRDLVCGRAEHHVGHNPVGAMMILGLLAVLAALVATGVIVLGGVIKEGPLASITTYAIGRPAKEVHELLAFALLGLVALHITGVITEGLRTRENLVRAMLTGTKRAEPHAITASVKRAHPWIAGGLSLATLALVAGGVLHLSQLPALGVPAAPLDAAYVRECKSCHAPHHPSLASAATWSGVMSRLDDHFGDNASLEPDLTANLTQYLTANAAEHWDTMAANLLLSPSAAEPLRITATEGWRRIHREIPDDVFKRKSVGGKLNCAGCHGDADTGRFAPRAISIPKEKTTP
jgi:cytochrome b